MGPAGTDSCVIPVVRRKCCAHSVITSILQLVFFVHRIGVEKVFNVMQVINNLTFKYKIKWFLVNCFGGITLQIIHTSMRFITPLQQTGGG